MGAMARCQETTVEGHPEDWYQGDLKAQCSKDADGTILPNENAMVAADVVEETFPSMVEVLPPHLLADIINRLKDARDLASCIATSKSMSDAVQQVQVLHLVCRRRYYELARERHPIAGPARSSYPESSEDESGDSDSEGEVESEEELEEEEHVCEWSQDSWPGRHGQPNSSGLYPSEDEARDVSFKHACLNMVHHVDSVEQLRIEVDLDMQANPFLKGEIHMVDFWLSEPSFVRNWVSACSHSLRHLTLIDYGQQAIMRQTSVLRVISRHCKILQSLELRNMFLDTNDLEELPSMKSLTIRCIKMTARSLTDITQCMPALVSLALVSIFGVQDAQVSSPNLEVLCLGLSTSARIVDLDLPKVKKLQLKMTCPDTLRVCAPLLAYVAVCMDNRDGSVVEFENVNNLRELLFGASHFSTSTFSTLMTSNPFLEKIFLDVPCMALADDGRWEGVLPQIPLLVPDIESLKGSCRRLHTLSVGPGLWHAMEETFASEHNIATFRNWPALSRLIVHMVVLNLENCISLLRWLVDHVPSLQQVEIYVHLDSPVNIDHLWLVCHEHLRDSKVQWAKWKRSLNFSCFSF